MDEPDPNRDLSVYLNHASSNTIHWLLSLTFLLIFSGLASVFAFAERLILSTNLFLISGIYCLFDTLFFQFNDPNNHENKTSKGTAWFLTILFSITIFFGLLINGSKLLPTKIRNYKVGEKVILKIFQTFGILSTLTSFVRISLAVVALLGFCYSEDSNHTGQCLAHGIMGTAFIFYGLVMLLWLMIPWFRNQKTKYAPEFWDSIVITVWGFINTFTEHRPWEPWSHGDYQHTAMGIIWWCMGLVGIYLSKDGSRSFIPGAIIAFTGWSMSVHVQLLEISTKVHYFFGLALMFAGFGRIIEICFVLKDQRSIPGKILTFQYIPSFGLVEAGLLFMSANEEQLVLVKDMGAGHASYIMLITSAASLIFLFALFLIDSYLKLVGVDKFSGGELNINRDVYSTLENQADDFELESLNEENI